MGEGVVVRPDQVALGVLVHAVGRDAVDEAVAVCGVREKRSDAKLPAHVVAYVTWGLWAVSSGHGDDVVGQAVGQTVSEVIGGSWPPSECG
jgi:Insertion element 4 transposase N-terminal